MSFALLDNQSLDSTGKRHTRLPVWLTAMTKSRTHLLLPGIRAAFCSKCDDIYPSFIAVCLSNSTLFSASVGCVHKWHHNDNYNNYESIQQQLCLVVSASSTLHNCKDGLIVAKETSWAIIHHPPRFFSVCGKKSHLPPRSALLVDKQIFCNLLLASALSLNLLLVD